MPQLVRSPVYSPSPKGRDTQTDRTDHDSINWHHSGPEVTQIDVINIRDQSIPPPNHYQNVLLYHNQDRAHLDGLLYNRQCTFAFAKVNLDKATASFIPLVQPLSVSSCLVQQPGHDIFFQRYFHLDTHLIPIPIQKPPITNIDYPPIH